MLSQSLTESGALTRRGRRRIPRSLPGCFAGSQRWSLCCSYPNAARLLSADGHASRSSHSNRSPSRRCSSHHLLHASRPTNRQPCPSQYRGHGPSPDKHPLAARRALEIDSRRRVVSRGNGMGRAAPSICGVSETGADVFLCEIGKVAQDVCVRHARSQILEHIMHGDAQTADARFARALARFDSDDFGVIHWSIRILPLPRLPRKPDSTPYSMLPAPSSMLAALRKEAAGNEKHHPRPHTPRCRARGVVRHAKGGRVNFPCASREDRFAPMSVGANQSSVIFFNPWLN